MDLGTAVGAIQLVYNGQGVQQAKADLSSLSQQGVATGAAMIGAGAAIGGLGAGIVKGLGDAIGIAADVQAGLLSIEAATNAPKESLEALDQTIGDLGKDTIFTAQDVVDAADTMAKAGISVEDQVGGALKTVTDLAAATDEGLTTSAGAVADAMAIFNLAGEDTAQIADLTTQAVNASKIGLTEYAAGFRNLAPIMASFASDSQEAIDLLGQTGEVVAFFTANGLKGADAGISFSRMIQNLATPTTEKYAQAIKDAGIELFDASGEFVGAEEAIRQVNEAFKGLSDAERLELLDKLGIGAEAQDVVGIISAVGDEFGNFVDEMEDGNTAAEAAEIRMQGLNGAMESLTGSISEVMRQAGGAFLAPLEGIVRAVTEVVNAFLSLPDGVIQALATIAGIFGVVTAAVGAFLAAQGAILLFNAALGAIGLTAGPVIAAIVAIVAALAALAAAYQSNFLGLKDAVDGVMRDIGQAVNLFRKRFDAAFQKNQAEGMNDLAAAVDAFGNALLFATGIDITGFTEQAAVAIDAFGDALEENLNNGVNPLAAALGALGSAAEALGFENVAAQLVDASQAVTKFTDTFAEIKSAADASGVNGLSASIQAFGAALSDVLGIDVTGPFNAIASAIQTVVDALNAARDALGEGLGNALNAFVNNVVPGVVSALGNVLGTIRDIGAELMTGDFSMAADMLGEAVNRAGEWAGNVAQGLADAVAGMDLGQVAQNVATALGNALQGIGSFLGSVDWGGVVSAVGQALLGAFQNIGSFLGTLSNIVGNAIRQGLEGIGNFLGGLDVQGVVQAVSDALLNAFNVGGEWLSGVAENIGSALGAALSTIGNFLGDLNFGDLVSRVVSAITGAFGGGGGDLPGPQAAAGHGAGGGGFEGVAQALGSALGAALNTIGSFLGDIDISGAAEDVRSRIEEAFNGLEFNLSELGTALTSAIEAACGVDLSGVFDTLGTAVQGAIQQISSLAAGIPGWISQIQSAFDSVPDMSGVFDTIGSAIQGAIQALSSLAAGIGGWMQTIAKAFDELSGLSIPDIAGAFNAIGTAISELPGKLAGSLPAILETVTGWADDIIAKMGEVKDAIGEALGAITQGDESFKPVMSPNDAVMQALFGAGGGLATDQAADAANQVGDFATNFVNNIAASFATVDWSPVTNAINAGLQGALQGGGAIPGPQLAAGHGAGAAGTGIGTTIASDLVTQIAAAFTPEVFAPIKTAFDTALASAFSTAAEAAGAPAGVSEGGGGAASGIVSALVQSIAAGFTPEAFAPIKTAFDAALAAAFAGATGGTATEGGGATGVAQTIVQSIASGLGSQVETLRSALQAVVTAAGQGLTGLQTVGQTIVQQIASGIGPAAGTLISALNAAITAAISGATGAAAGATAIGTALVTAAGSGVGAATGTLTAAVQAMVQAGISAGTGAAAGATAIGQAIATNAGAGIGGSTGNLISAVQAMVQAAIAAGVGAAAGASAIGAAISSGAAGGVNVHALDAAVAEMVNNGIAAGMAAAGAASPSQVAREEIGQPIGEGAALGVDDTAAQFTSSIDSMVQQGMSAADSALQMARDLFSQYGLTFGNDISEGMGQALSGPGSKARESLTGLADQLRASVEERVSQLRENQKAWLPSAENVMAMRNPWAHELMRDQDVTVNFEAILDGEKMSDWTVRESLGGLLGVDGRGGRKRGMRQPA